MEMKITPYPYNKAVERTQLYEYPSERNLWLANKILKKAIKRSSFSGLRHTDIEITLYSSGFEFDNEGQIYATVTDLKDMYDKVGYVARIRELTNGWRQINGYRLEVTW